MVLVGVFAFCALLTLASFAPDLRGGGDGGAHALSKSAVGFAGLAKALQLEGEPVFVSRHRLPAGRTAGLLVQTPPPTAADKTVTPMGFGGPVLVILPKWLAAPDPGHRGWVRKLSILDPGLFGQETLIRRAGLARRTGTTRPVLHGLGGAFPAGFQIAEGPVEQLQSIALADWGWTPVLADETGRVILARAPYGPVYLLSDPDLFNTQGLKSLDTLAGALMLVDRLRAEAGPVIFDVTLDGLGQQRALGRLAFEPPFLSVTLCLAAAAVLAGLQAVRRFGPVAPAARALALGKDALIDNTAALVRLAGREARMGGRYAALTRDLAAKAVGAPRDLSIDAQVDLLDRLGERRGATDTLARLTDLAGAAPDRARVTEVAARLFHWRLETTREP